MAAQGADHIFFSTQDKGGCWVPAALRRSIVVSYFGYTQPMVFFGHEVGAPMTCPDLRGWPPWATISACISPGISARASRLASSHLTCTCT